MAYSHIQLVAYEVPTLYATAAGPDVGLEACAPVPEKLALDPKLRLRRFARVANFARQRQLESFGKDRNTLNVLIAPKYYFRPNFGVHNSYDMNLATWIMYSLRQMFTGNEWQDWLVVPGSIFWREAISQFGNVYWNTTMLIQGGTNGRIAFIDKPAIAHEDGAPLEAAKQCHPYSKEYLSEVARQKSIVSICDICVGVEFCEDHARRYLKESAVKRRSDCGAGPKIALQILIACGMPLNPEAIAAKVDGYVVRVDGMPSPFGVNWRHPRSQIVRVACSDLDDEMTRAEYLCLSRTPGTVALDVPAEYQSLASSSLRRNYPQRVTVYARQAF